MFDNEENEKRERERGGRERERERERVGVNRDGGKEADGERDGWKGEGLRDRDDV